MAFPLSIIVNLAALVNPAINAYREKHYTKRSTAIINGIGILITGITIITSYPDLYLYSIPFSALPILYGAAGIILTSKRENIGLKMLGSRLVLGILVLILLIQFGTIALPK